MRKNGCIAGNGKTKGRVSKLRFYGDNFVLDTVSGRFYRLTPIAGFVLKSLMGGIDPDQLAEIVEKKFGTDRTKAARHVELFLSDLSSLELIENRAH
jgi:hypothetical protein